MKQIKSLYSLFILILLLNYSCKHDKRNNNLCPDLLSEVTDTLRYSNFVDSISYIHLETSDECLIGKITDVIFTDENIFVLDEYKQIIWIFNKRGEYLTQIARKGNGPEEYTKISQIEYDKAANQILALDMWNKAILYYDLNGNFIKKIELEIYVSDFKIVPQGGYIISNAERAKPDAGIYLTNTRGEVIRKLVMKLPEHMHPYNAYKELYDYNDTIAFIAPNFENGIYHYTYDSLELKYPFKFSPEVKNVYKENTYKKKKDDFTRTMYMEGKKWILIIFWSEKYDLRNFLYCKETNQYWIGKFLLNDIDGFQSRDNTSISANNQFVFWCENRDSPEDNPILQILHLK